MKKQVNLVAKYYKTNLAVRLLSSPKRLKRSIVNDTKNIGSWLYNSNLNLRSKVGNLCSFDPQRIFDKKKVGVSKTFLK